MSENKERGRLHRAALFLASQAGGRSQHIKVPGTGNWAQIRGPESNYSCRASGFEFLSSRMPGGLRWGMPLAGVRAEAGLA